MRKKWLIALVVLGLMDQSVSARSKKVAPDLDFSNGGQSEVIVQFVDGVEEAIPDKAKRLARRGALELDAGAAHRQEDDGASFVKRSGGSVARRRASFAARALASG